MQHILLGIKGEILAQKYLRKNKYKILKTNFKNKIGEIDIIAQKNSVIVFVEVKTRTTTKYGRASEAVDFFKQQKLRKVAQSYLVKEKLVDTFVRFDVIEVYDKEINHIQNAFWRKIFTLVIFNTFSKKIKKDLIKTNKYDKIQKTSGAPLFYLLFCKG